MCWKLVRLKHYLPELNAHIKILLPTTVMNWIQQFFGFTISCFSQIHMFTISYLHFYYILYISVIVSFFVKAFVVPNPNFGDITLKNGLSFIENKDDEQFINSIVFPN